MIPESALLKEKRLVRLRKMKISNIILKNIENIHEVKEAEEVRSITTNETRDRVLVNRVDSRYLLF